MRSALHTFLATALMFLAFSEHPSKAEDGFLPQDRSSAVIFSYYRVGEDSFPGANIRLEQFTAHIRELKEGGYNVLPLPEIVDALKNGATLPDHTVALTFDGGYKSILENAVPVLTENNIPFTVFISTEYVDRESDEYIGWADLKKLAKNRLVTIGLHPAIYTHLTNEPEEELRRQVNNARARMREVMEIEPALFAYPFGEYSAVFRGIIETAGFKAAFGQQSGVAYTGEDMFTLPRFSMTESFGDIDRFRMTASALPLPVTDVQPKDPHLDIPSPVIGFTIDESLRPAMDRLSCFASGQDSKPQLEHVGGGRVELRLDTASEDDKARINCTMPGPPGEADDPPRWRWFGMLMTISAPEQGSAEPVAEQE